MPAINFTKFIDKILSGEKKQTIRLVRKYPVKVGDTLYLYLGLRTKNAKLLKTVRCKKIDRILIQNGWVYVNSELLDIENLFKLIRADGFETFKEFAGFFRTTYPGDCFERDCLLLLPVEYYNEETVSKL